jgi:LPS-assembly lipoprotein
MRCIGRFVQFVCVLLLSGCGFHLQGATHLPAAFKVTYLDAADRYTEFHQALSQQLKSAGAQVVSQQARSNAVIEIVNDETSQRVLSISAANIPTEYEISYKIKYRVRLGAQEVVPLQSLVLTRSYSFTESAALAKEREQEIIRSALAKDLAGLVMRRLAVLTQ